MPVQQAAEGREFSGPPDGLRATVSADLSRGPPLHPWRCAIGPTEHQLPTYLTSAQCCSTIMRSTQLIRPKGTVLRR